jgi:hypothetical protein
MGRGPAGFLNVSDCILANTQSKDLVKCFNSTGFNNIENPVYQNIVVDMFMAGDSVEGKKIAKQLALDAGFEQCYDIGGNDKFTLLEQFAFFWINTDSKNNIVQFHLCSFDYLFFGSASTKCQRANNPPKYILNFGLKYIWIWYNLAMFQWLLNF